MKFLLHGPGAAAGLGDGVELVKEEDAGRGAPRLVEHVADVGLGLSEPHGQQLGALDRDEVGLALVSDGLGEQRLTAAYNGNKNIEFSNYPKKIFVEFLH